MTGSLPIDWATLATSLFNMILLLWLGSTVWLNAERRSLGIWIAGGQLVLGGVFFVIHSVIIGQGWLVFDSTLTIWWRLGWFPVVSLPYAWYVVMLWYGGYWHTPTNPLRLRQRLWFALASLAALTILVLLFVANPLPDLAQLSYLQFRDTPAWFGIPILIWIYPAYILLCISLSIDAIYHPSPPGRLMGDRARQRARPWLAGASVVLVLVSFLVGAVMIWIVRILPVETNSTTLSATLGWFDLAIALLIAIAILLVGQAIVSYEIFTGVALPRGDLRRYWQRAIILAAGLGIASSWLYQISLPAIYQLLTSLVLVVLFYALLSWRAFSERERSIAHLRPFVSSQHLFEHLLHSAPSMPNAGLLKPALTALCAEVLNASRAFLIPWGALASLSGEAVVYPDTAAEELPAVGDLAQRFSSPDMLGIPLPPGSYGQAVWGVPLWSERGLVGILLLGEKNDGGLYTREEIEIARTVGERLLDLQATTTLARRLMHMQRQRMQTSQVVDQQTRRVLHDDVLPHLHTTMLTLSSMPGLPDEVAAELIDDLSSVHRQISALLREIPPAASPEVARWGILGALQRTLAGEFKHSFHEVEWQINPHAERRAAELPSLAGEVVYYAARELVRNAATHARPAHTSVPLCLRIQAEWQEGLAITIQDNGRGFDPLDSNSSHGQGLLLHSTLLAVIGASLTMDSLPGKTTRVCIFLPARLWENHE